eukprot:scaffold72670_cov30-Tisochrysis_lutea.AAC.2
MVGSSQSLVVSASHHRPCTCAVRAAIGDDDRRGTFFRVRRMEEQNEAEHSGCSEKLVKLVPSRILWSKGLLSTGLRTKPYTTSSNFLTTTALCAPLTGH